MEEALVDLDTLEVVTSLMWPDFVEVAGCVFLSAQFSEDSRTSFLEGGVTGAALEDVLNHVHVYDFVSEYGGSEEDLRRLELVAERIRDSWQAGLAKSFPGRSFTVSLATEPDEYGPTVSFHQAALCESCGSGRV